MPSPTLRYAGHAALEKLEWIERHVSTRPDDRKTRERLIDEIDDLRHIIVMKMIGGLSERSKGRKLVDKERLKKRIAADQLQRHNDSESQALSDTTQG